MAPPEDSELNDQRRMMRDANEWFPGISSNYKTYPHYRNKFAISFDSAALEDNK
jgi:hypothetical protein